ncbi:hypothetical protein LJC14_01580 [Treponema sp. OttesenSCG-928-L16]|nr:hypothetical protein [Treponema sp. OttesenSCG-928-L16]
MKVLGIKDIERKDVPIYYRRLFTGTAVFDIFGKSMEGRIDFSIETKPTGHKDITVSLLDPIDYPLIPLVAALRRTVDDLDEAGGLPG